MDVLYVLQKKMISEYVKSMIDKHLNGDPDRFQELWDTEPNFQERLKHEIEEQNSWVYLETQTYDGWYLISKDGGFDLFYQERGVTHWGVRHFEDERTAFTELLKSATDFGHEN